VNNRRVVRDTRAFTLVELIVVIALLGFMSGVVAIGLGSLQPRPEQQSMRVLSQARAEAIRSGRAVRIIGSSDGGESGGMDSLLFLPDGSARGIGVDVLTGRPHAEP
jgi:prepilin-type N-terminal cleavage/methylation domain-containing protein